MYAVISSASKYKYISRSNCRTFPLLTFTGVFFLAPLDARTSMKSVKGVGGDSPFVAQSFVGVDEAEKKREL